jgi:hypothetical protein
MSETKPDFGDFLKRKDLSYDIVVDGDKTIYKIQQYAIIHGKYSGKIIQIGIPIPKDFPITAPYGMHVKSDHGFTESIPNANNPSALGSDWNFWSRGVNNWNDPANRTCQYYFDHINRWLELS